MQQVSTSTVCASICVAHLSALQACAHVHTKRWGSMWVLASATHVRIIGGCLSLEASPSCASAPLCCGLSVLPCLLAALGPCPCCCFVQVFIDTTGWAFTYPLAKLVGSRVVCYVHYPTVSTNMLGRVWSRQAMYNNDDAIRSSSIKSLIKVLYYQAFALVYGIAGACAGGQGGRMVNGGGLDSGLAEWRSGGVGGKDAPGGYWAGQCGQGRLAQTL